MSGATVVISPAGYSVAPTSGLYADAYSTYATRVVDLATSSDVAGGTSRTVSVNGVTGTYQCYKTIQYGINDWLTQGGRRLIVKAGTHSMGASLFMPAATGKTDTNRVVLMGDPAETAWPVIDFGGASNNFRPNWNADANFVTTRKMEFTNSSMIAAMIHAVAGLYSFQGLIIEYCHVHGITRTDNDNGAGICVEGESIGGTFNTGVIIRYNRVHDIHGSVTWSENLCGIQSFHTPSAQVYRNEVYDTNCGIYQKGQPDTVVPGGWNIYGNVLHDLTTEGIRTSIQGAGQPGLFSGNKVYNNLFYAITGSAWASLVYETGGQCTDFQMYQNTIAEDVGGLFDANAVTNIDIHSNVSAASLEQVSLDGPGGGYANSLAECNYNAYYSAQGQNWYTHRYAGTVNYSSLSAWRSAYPTDTQLAAAADAASITFSSLSSVFTNAATRNYAPLGALIGAGKGGVNIGYDPATCGPGWS